MGKEHRKNLKMAAILAGDLLRPQRLRIGYYPYIYKKFNPSQHALYRHMPRHVAAAYASPLALLALKRLCPARVVVFHIHWLVAMLRAPDAFLAQVEQLKRAGVIIVWTVHNTYEHDRSDREAETAFRTRLAALADIVHVHSAQDPGILNRYYPVAAGKCVVAPHGNYIGIYPNTRSRSQCREALGIPSGDTVFLFFGMIRPYKGLEELLEAFAPLAQQHPGALLLVVGMVFQWPQGAAALARTPHPRIRVIEGFVPGARIQDYMNAADFVVLPYKDILTSGGALLALSFARPVIAPRIGALQSLIDDGSDGLLYDPSAPENLRHALTRALSLTQETRSRMDDAARRKASLYPWEKSSRILYDAIMARAKNP